MYRGFESLRLRHFQNSTSENNIFSYALFSKDEILSPAQKRFYSCVGLVADKFVPATFYLNKSWVDTVQGLEMQAPSNHPKLAYITYKDWKSHPKDEEKLPVKFLSHEFVLGNDLVNKAALEDQGLNAHTAILCLAATGINLMLPNVSFELFAEEEIEEIKLKLSEERKDYINAISSISDESFDRISSGSYTDISRWARNEFGLKIAPKAKVLEENTHKLDKKTLEKAGFKFWSEGVPSIGQSFINDGLYQGLKTTGDELLKLVVSTLAKNYTDKNLPEVAYAFKITEEVKR